MPRGGARAGSGPAKDPNSLRSMKLAEKGGFKMLPREHTAPAPEWPLEMTSVRELELWDKLWAKPQAHIWSVQGNEFEVAIHVRTMNEAEKPNVQTSTRTLLLQQMNSLLLTEAALSKAGYKIAGIDEAFETTSGPSKQTPRPSSRARLKAVPDVGPDR